METLTLNADQIKRLETSILELPGKYSIPLLQLINGFAQENVPPRPDPVTKEENHISPQVGP